MRAKHTLPVLLAFALSAGCPQNEPPPEVPTAPVPPPEPPPPPPPVEVPFEAVAVSPDGARLAIAPDGSTTIVPEDARFELASEHAFRSLRVRLFNERDRLVPSSDEIVIGRGTTVRLTPEKPLESGQSYRLLVDDAREPMLRDIEDKAYLARSIRFTVASPDESAGGAGSAE